MSDGSTLRDHPRRHSPTDDLQELRAALERTDLSAHERLVMTVLVLHRNGQTGRCDPSVSRLVQWTGISRWSVMRAIADLEGRQLVRCHRRQGAKTSYVVNPTGSTGQPVADSDRLQGATPPVADSYMTGSTQLPERTKNGRRNERSASDSHESDERGSNVEEPGEGEKHSWGQLMAVVREQLHLGRDGESCERSGNVLKELLGKGVRAGDIMDAMRGARKLIDAGRVEGIPPGVEFGLRGLRDWLGEGGQLWDRAIGHERSGESTQADSTRGANALKRVAVVL